MSERGGRGEVMKFAFRYNNSNFSIKKKNNKLEGCKHVAGRPVSKDSIKNRCNLRGRTAPDNLEMTQTFS